MLKIESRLQRKCLFSNLTRLIYAFSMILEGREISFYCVFSLEIAFFHAKLPIQPMLKPFQTKVTNKLLVHLLIFDHCLRYKH